MFYVDVRAEVRTRHSLPRALASGKKIVVPYCVDGELELFHLESMDELEVGMYRILEPKRSCLSTPRAGRRRRSGSDHRSGGGVRPEGGADGPRRGYYDKLLEHARPQTPLVALAFECQLFPEIPMQSHDIYMDLVVTESMPSTGVSDGPDERELAESTPAASAARRPSHRAAGGHDRRPSGG